MNGELTMTSTAVSSSHRAIAIAGTVHVEDLVREWLSGRSARTVEAYRQDLTYFASFVEAEDIDSAASFLLGQGHGKANFLVLNFRNWMIEEGLAPATVNRRLSAIRSLVQLARTLSMVPWSLSIKGIKSDGLRDTKGCGIEGFRLLLGVASKQRNRTKCKRDRAILRCLFDVALRRSEVAGLSTADVDLAGRRLMVIGKGRREKEALTLPDQTCDALEEWLEVRGDNSGPLFLNCDRARKGKGITSNGIYKLVRSLGDKARIHARPHGLRHAAITSLLDLLNGNVRVVKRFARHASAQTTLRYDDNRQDEGGEAAKRLAAAV